MMIFLSTQIIIMIKKKYDIEIRFYFLNKNNIKANNTFYEV